jgi:hypothetical protein
MVALTSPRASRLVGFDSKVFASVRFHLSRAEEGRGTKYPCPPRGGGEILRKTTMAIALSVAVIMFAPLVSAGGGNGNGSPNGNGNWGNKDLPMTVDFATIASDPYEDAYGWMNWSAALADFKFDFHGYNVVEGVYYCLTYTTDEAPVAGDPVLGWGTAVLCDNDLVRVHIKGEIAWPNVVGATLNLVGYPLIDEEYVYTPVLESVEPVDLLQQ